MLADLGPNWVPAWRRWSTPRWRSRGTNRGLDVELVPPHLDAPCDESDDGMEAWDDDHLELFLQQCELEAGWRSELDLEEAVGKAGSWKALERDLFVRGITVPRLEEEFEPAASALAPKADQSLALTSDAGGQAFPQVVEARSRPTAGALRGQGPRKRCQKWKPTVLCWDGGPILEEALEGPMEDAGTRAVAPPSYSPAAPPSGEPPAEGSVGGRRPRPRGRRQRGNTGNTEVDIISFNGSGAVQSLRALELLKDRRRRTAAVLFQEHHARGDALADLQSQVAALGWKVAAAPATDGRGGGASAGTAVAVPLHRGWSTTAAGRWDLSPRGSPGRLSGAWVQAGPRAGLLLLSVYFWTNEGPSDRNIALLETGLAVAAEFGGPWVMAGDMNMTPTQLRQAAGRLLDRAGAVIRSPGVPTNFPGRGEAREIDYFIVDYRIAGCVSRASVHGDIAGEPHRAVTVTLSGRDATGLIQAVVRPKAFPCQRPVGCPRQPVLPREAGHSKECTGREALERTWTDISECIEAELSRECDLVDSVGRPLNEHCGRGAGLKVRWKQLLPARIVGSFGQANPQLHYMVWCLNRLEELLHLAVAAEEGGGPPLPRRAEQWHRIVHNLARPKGNLDKLIKSDGAWAGLRELVLQARSGPRGLAPDLRRMAVELQQAITVLKLRLSRERREAWRAWVVKHIGKGGGGAAQVHQEENRAA